MWRTPRKSFAVASLIQTAKPCMRQDISVKYFIGCPRLIWDLCFQDACDNLLVSVDTDFAGCLSTRRSTSGGAAMRGKHLLRHWSLTQATVTLSSAEAELGASQKEHRHLWASSRLQRIWEYPGHSQCKRTPQPRSAFVAAADSGRSVT